MHIWSPSALNRHVRSSAGRCQGEWRRDERISQASWLQHPGKRSTGHSAEHRRPVAPVLLVPAPGQPHNELVNMARK